MDIKEGEFLEIKLRGRVISQDPIGQWVQIDMGDGRGRRTVVYYDQFGLDSGAVVISKIPEPFKAGQVWYTEEDDELWFVRMIPNSSHQYLIPSDWQKAELTFNRFRSAYPDAELVRDV